MTKIEALTIQVHNQQLGGVTPFHLHRTTPVKLLMVAYARGMILGHLLLLLPIMMSV